MNKSMVGIILVALLAVAAYGIFGIRANVTVLGEAIPDEAEIITVKQSLELAEKGGNPEVVVKGKIVEKCPTSGCWFYVSDDTGRVRVDTQFSGFTVADHKIGSKVIVYGRAVKPQNGEAEMTALGAKFQ